MATRFGLYLPQLRMSFPTILERVHAAEAAGFDSVWFMDHLAVPAGPEHDCFEAWTTATAVAARTSTIRVGHLVLCDALRHPAVLAKMVATLDVISGGRLELGLGWGSMDEELAAYGISTAPAAERAARLGETLDALALLLSGDRVTYEGRFLRLEGAISRPTPVQARVPVHLGGAGTVLTMPLVARHADWWNCPSYALGRFDELRPLAGPAKVSVQHPLGLARSRAERDDVVALTHRRFGAWGGVVAGTADEVADELRREQALGVDMFIVQFHDFATPETVEHFMREVAPAVG